MITQTEFLERRINSKYTRKLCGGISDMSLYRWLKNERLGFPQPVYIQKRRYWREAEIVAWLDRQSASA